MIWLNLLLIETPKISPLLTLLITASEEKVSHFILTLPLRLGAKPAREKCLPYAELKEKRSKEKEEKLNQLEERKNAMAGVQKKAKGPAEKSKGVKGKSKKRTKSDMKVGSFDGGMLKLSSKELSRLKGKK